MKSKLNFELYQSQCLQLDGVLQTSSFVTHPYRGVSREGEEYDRLGESAYLARKGEQFRAAVRADPADFARRIGERFVAVVLWYTPRDGAGSRTLPPGCGWRESCTRSRGWRRG